MRVWVFLTLFFISLVPPGVWFVPMAMMGGHGGAETCAGVPGAPGWQRACATRLPGMATALLAHVCLTPWRLQRKPEEGEAGQSPAGVQGGPPIHPTQEGRVRHSSPVPARSFCMHKMAAEARRSIWNPGEGELRKWPPER